MCMGRMGMLPPAQRNFDRADAIRDELAAEGIQIEDGVDGTRWRRS